MRTPKRTVEESLRGDWHILEQGGPESVFLGASCRLGGWLLTVRPLEGCAGEGYEAAAALQGDGDGGGLRLSERFAAGDGVSLDRMMAAAEAMAEPQRRRRCGSG